MTANGKGPKAFELASIPQAHGRDHKQSRSRRPGLLHGLTVLSCAVVPACGGHGLGRCTAFTAGPAGRTQDGRSNSLCTPRRGARIVFPDLQFLDVAGMAHPISSMSADVVD